MSGYVYCACRDCFEIAIGGDDDAPALCNECEEAGCDASGASECEREPDMEGSHWGYGSGMVGCLFDNQGTADTRADAIDSALHVFALAYAGDTDEENEAIDAALKDARETLAHSPSYYFPSALRHVFGADYIEVWEDYGPCPEEG